MKCEITLALWLLDHSYMLLTGKVAQRPFLSQHFEAHALCLQEAIDIVAQYPDNVEQGVAKLLQISRERWAAIQGGRTCDDITAVVTKLNANIGVEAQSA